MSKNLHRMMLSAALAAFISTPLSAQIVPQQEQPRQVQTQTSRAPVTLKQWSRLPKRDRQIAIVAAVEGLMLAASSPNGPPNLSNQCLSEDTPETAEQKLGSLVDRYGDEAFVDVFLVLTKCMPQGGK